jgi:hypothetical protein
VPTAIAASWFAYGLTRQGRDFDFLAQRLATKNTGSVCPIVVGRGLSGKLVYGIDYDDQYVLDMTVLLARLNVSEVSWVGTSLGLIGILIGGLRNSPVRRLVENDIGRTYRSMRFCGSATMSQCSSAFQIFSP